MIGVGVTREVPKSVIRQVDYGRFIRRRGVIHRPSVSIIEAVGDRNIEVAGIAFFAVFRFVFQDEFNGIRTEKTGFANESRIPNDGIEAFVSAVQRVGAVVLRERKFLAIQGEFPICNAVAESTDDRAEERPFPFVVGNGFQICGDVGDFSISVWQIDGVHNSAEGEDFDGDSATVIEFPDMYGFTVGCFAEFRGIDGHISPKQSSTDGKVLSEGLF